MEMQDIIIKSFNGIGDLLFVTPTLRKIKEFYPESKITINTNYPHLLTFNPHIDEIGNKNEGLFLGYPDPIHAKNPTMHHIQFDYRLIKKHFHLDLLPDLLKDEDVKPEMYGIEKTDKTNKIGVQVSHKGHWHLKKVWPYFEKLIKSNPELYEPIPKCKNVIDLVNKINKYKAVICAEGGISHIARAVNTHAIVIYGGFAKPEWNGYQNHINISNSVVCSYCYNSFPCPANIISRKCLKDISIQHVIRKVEGLNKIPELEKGNAKQFIEKLALKYCKGKGIDVGGGKWPLNGAISIDLQNGQNANRLNIASESQDYVFSSHCLEHNDNYYIILLEMYRVLKPEGILFIYLPHPDYLPWRKENLGAHKQNIYPEDITKTLKVMGLKEIQTIKNNFYFGHTHIYRKI